MKNIFKDRRFKYGSFATIFTVVFIVAIIIINTIFTVLADRFPLSLDLTRDSIFELSPETVDYIKNLDQDVEIVLFSPEETFVEANDSYNQASKVINKYQLHSSRIKVTYVDTVKNPTYVTSNFPDLELNPASIVVKSGSKVRQLKVNDLFNIKTDYYGSSYIASSKAEQTMTSAILGVTAKELVKISILNGLGGENMSDFVSLLEQNNYEVVEQNILTEEIDPDAQVVILFAPSLDANEEILKKLSDFMLNNDNYGKNLLYFTDYEQKETPNLDAFLAEWGIKINPGVIFDTDTNNLLAFQSFQYCAPIVKGTDENFALTDMESSQSYVVFPFSRPLEKVFDEYNGFKVSSLLEFAATSGFYPEGIEKAYTPTAADATGPYPAMLKSTKTRYDSAGQPLSSNLVVSSSIYSVMGSILSSPSLKNSQYYLNMINVLTDREEQLYIESKTIGGSVLNITQQQLITLGVVFVIVIPLIILAIGIVVWLRRKNK